jgi:hypothetical protein
LIAGGSDRALCNRPVEHNFIIKADLNPSIEMKNPPNPITLAISLASMFSHPACAAPQSKPASFASDMAFLKEHTDVVVLKNGSAAVAVVPSYQGRVMTSSYDATSGPSFGWINRPVIQKGILSDEETKGKLEEHIYIFGGEERFWLGPEGGQYAIFFKPGSKFEFAEWATPPVIDTEPFKLVKLSSDTAVFSHEAQVVNFSGTTFSIGIGRTVRMLGAADAGSNLGIKTGTEIRLVGYETDNRLTNLGKEAWTPEKGLLSIWILGMYNPSPKTTVAIPFKPGAEAELGPKVNDTYFGKVPPEYLKVGDDTLFLRGDGTRRGKIGVNAKRSKGIAGSYDAAGQVLTIVTYNVQPSPNGYVNSMWEMQQEPYWGDVLNAYNDGSPEPGAPPLGPFFELESSSPAAALKPGETIKHVQRTYHFHGPEALLEPLSVKLLGVGLKTIRSQFGS